MSALELLRALDPAGYRVSPFTIAYFGCAALVLSLLLVVLTGRRFHSGAEGVPAPRRAFAANAGLVAAILVFVGATYSATGIPQAAACGRFSIAGLALVGPSTLHFVCALVGWRRQLVRLRVVSWIVCTTIALLCLGTNLVVDGAWRVRFGFSPHAGLLLPVHLLVTFVIMVIALACCAVRARSSVDPTEKQRLRLVVIAYAIGSLGIADVLPAWGIDFYPSSFVWLTIAAAILTYAIREHRLLDSPDLGWRALGWFVTSALVAVPLAGFFVWTGGWHGWGAPALTTALLYFVFLLLRVYYARVQPAIDDLFLRRRRDLVRDLDALTVKLLVVHTADAIAEAVSALLLRTLYVKLVVFATRDDGGVWRTVSSAWGRVVPPSDDDLFVRALAGRPVLVTRPSVEAFGEAGGVAGDTPRLERGATMTAAERMFARYGAAAVVPLISPTPPSAPSGSAVAALLGIIAVGPRPDGYPFDPMELAFLRRLALIVAPAASAARLFDRRQRLRAELEDKVATRRSDLARALVGLESAQNQLVQREKMATLGVVVAGVASELEAAVETVGKSVPALKDDVVTCDEAAIAALAALPAGPAADDVRRFAARAKLDYVRKDVHPLVAAVAEGARRARAISGDLRRFSRPDEAQRIPTDVHRELDSAASLVAQELGERIQLVRAYAADLPLVECDPGPIGQVFMNLLINAAQAIGEAHRDGTITLHTRLIDQGERVEIGIRDTGKGIAPEHVDRIFEPFFTTKSLGSRGGTGLGLSISYGIVQQHGGSIQVDSQLGQGTEFRVILPLRGPARPRVTRAAQ